MKIVSPVSLLAFSSSIIISSAPDAQQFEWRNTQKSNFWSKCSLYVSSTMRKKATTITTIFIGVVLYWEWHHSFWSTFSTSTQNLCLLNFLHFFPANVPDSSLFYPLSGNNLLVRGKLCQCNKLIYFIDRHALYQMKYGDKSFGNFLHRCAECLHLCVVLFAVSQTHIQPDHLPASSTLVVFISNPEAGLNGIFLSADPPQEEMQQP